MSSPKGGDLVVGGKEPSDKVTCCKTCNKRDCCSGVSWYSEVCNKCRARCPHHEVNCVLFGR